MTLQVILCTHCGYSQHMREGFACCLSEQITTDLDNPTLKIPGLPSTTEACCRPLLTSTSSITYGRSEVLDQNRYLTGRRGRRKSRIRRYKYTCETQRSCNLPGIARRLVPKHEKAEPHAPPDLRRRLKCPHFGCHHCVCLTGYLHYPQGAQPYAHRQPCATAAARCWSLCTKDLAPTLVSVLFSLPIDAVAQMSAAFYTQKWCAKSQPAATSRPDQRDKSLQNPLAYLNLQ